jgi:hypothetical protein
VARLKLLLGDRRRRQRGSILSSVLIIVAFLSILIGAVMTELTSSFLIARNLVNRMQVEATATSAVELAIQQLQGGPVPPVCAQDSRGPWFLTLNGSPAAVTQTCHEIVPDLLTPLDMGAFTVDGVHDTVAGRNRYLITGASGVLRSYVFGQVAPSWSVAIGGPPTAAPLSMVGSAGSVVLLIPVAMAGPGCGGHCVALFNDGGGTPTFRCAMPAFTPVTSTPAAEISAAGSPNFPDYAFFGTSGAAGKLYVYDANARGSCQQLGSAALGGAAVGAPLVFPGPVDSKGKDTRIDDEIFVVVTDSNSTDLQHWRYTEETQSCNGPSGCGPVTTTSLTLVTTLSLTAAVGANVTGYAISSNVPANGANLSLVVASATGRLSTARIAVRSGPSYTMFPGAAAALPGGVSHAPYWCHCPGGQNLIGVGTTNGFLYVLTSTLAVQWSYDGKPDGWPAINTTPMADANGDWYFGASDGSVYDVEIPMSGPQMFKAAKFGPGGAIGSSPIVGSCFSGPCLYFGSTTAGSYFARLGTTRVLDVQACVTSAAGSTNCAVNPRLWARVEVGSSVVVGGRGVYVQGWSYYSP